MKTLKDVAKVYKDSALKAINPGVPYRKYKTGSSKAYKTGNLYKQVASQNRIQTMISEDKNSGKITFKFNVAPNGATYGEYVHYGKRRRGVMKPRPFAQIAAQSKEFQQIKDEVMNEKTSELLDDIFSDIRS